MNRAIVRCAVLLGVLLAGTARAADHRDGPGVKADIAADINDVFAWMAPDAARVYLVMTVFPFATEEARFSDSAQYVFHTNSGAAFGQITSPEVNIVCTFNAAQEITCRVGDTAVSGEYEPLSRPLFIYTDGSILTERPEALGFVNFYLENANALSEEVGYIPMSDAVLAQQFAKIEPFLP